jgi:hypothetical protein
VRERLSLSHLVIYPPSHPPIYLPVAYNYGTAINPFRHTIEVQPGVSWSRLESLQPKYSKYDSKEEYPMNAKYTPVKCPSYVGVDGSIPS